MVVVFCEFGFCVLVVLLAVGASVEKGFGFCVPEEEEEE